MQDEKKRQKRQPKKHAGNVKERIMHKKDRQRRQGRNVRKDTKYTGRARPGRF